MNADAGEAGGSLQASPQIGHNGAPVDNRPVYAERACPECMARFQPRMAGTLFCCPTHRDAWKNRQTVRGRVDIPYAYAARITRDGTRGTPEQRETGKQAARIHRKLVQRWRDEDRAAGRMPMVDFITEHLRIVGEPE